MSLLGRLTETIATKVTRSSTALTSPVKRSTTSTSSSWSNCCAVRRAVMDVASSQQHLEVQAEQLRQAASGLEARAREELSKGRGDNAREALARRTVIERGLASIAHPG